MIYSLGVIVLVVLSTTVGSKDTGGTDPEDGPRSVVGSVLDGETEVV